MGIAKRPSRLEALRYLAGMPYTNQNMLNGYEDGRWYVNGIVASKGDWVAVRLLYLALALDPSNMQIAEVKNAYGYYENKFGIDGLHRMFAELVKDSRAQKSFEKNPDSKAVREFHKTVVKDGGDFEES